ncbi:cell envelope integrity protein TolA [Ferruginibacter sp. SUN002]|uniref:cell envelope integrity protein TolA n=1 Tax=Ferruginibacter sp. SUN002 TaxID=2937789 RepID=UPI003D36E10A
MKKIFFLLSIFLSQYSFSQNAYSNYNKCLESIDNEERKAEEALENKWYEETSNPKAVMLACDDHCPKYYCRRHHKQCISYCDCYAQFKIESKSISEKYQTMRSNCEITYKREQEAENAKAERKRKAEEEARKAEEQRKKEEKARLEKEAKENADKEKSNLRSETKKSDGTNGNSDDAAEQETRRRKAEVEAYVAEMERRRQEQRTKDSLENVQMGAAMVASAGAMIAMGDKESSREEEDYEIGTYLKAVLGLGFNSLPVIENDNYYGTYMSISSTTSFPIIQASFQFSAFNRSFITWKLSPYGYFGMNAFDEGTTGTHFCYGGSSSLGFGKKFKLLLQGEYYVRNGSMSMDQFVNYIDSKGTANYSYSTKKYGPGIQLRLGYDVPTEYSLSAFKEELSFMKGENKEIYSFQFKMMAKIVQFVAEFSPDYPSAGDILFPATYKKEKQNLWTFGISVPLTLSYR